MTEQTSATVTHLTVVGGEDAGRTITVPANGVLMGRSSKNDVMLKDPSLSRYHCRFFFKSGVLWVADLGSANQTLLNQVPVQEAELHTGDTVIIGNTEIRVIDPRPAGIAAAAPAAKSAPSPAGRDFDLGLNKTTAEEKRRPRLLLLLSLLGMTLLAAALALYLVKGRQAARRPPPPPSPVVTPMDGNVEIDYEKVQANANNIFRYRLTLAKGILAIQIDDLQNRRHVRKETTIDNRYVQLLIQALQDTDFERLAPEYTGVQPDIIESWDLRVTLGVNTRRVRVINRVEPDAFRAAREKIEETGKNLLGLWAIEFSADKLLDMANQAYLLGKKYYDEREVRYENLGLAVKSLKEAEWYLETVEPKPDFYRDVIGQISTCTADLNKRYEDLNFRAQRAIKLRDWREAAKSLQIICEMLPDRSDTRHAQARKDLLDVENHMRLEK